MHTHAHSHTLKLCYSNPRHIIIPMLQSPCGIPLNVPLRSYDTQGFNAQNELKFIQKHNMCEVHMNLFIILRIKR